MTLEQEMYCVEVTAFNNSAGAFCLDFCLKILLLITAFTISNG